MCISPEVEVIKSEESVIAAREDENGPAEETDFSVVGLNCLLGLSAIKLCFVIEESLINKHENEMTHCWLKL